MRARPQSLSLAEPAAVSRMLALLMSACTTAGDQTAGQCIGLFAIGQHLLPHILGKSCSPTSGGRVRSLCAMPCNAAQRQAHTLQPAVRKFSGLLSAHTHPTWSAGS